ncbi:DEAD/DEAH box helicase [Proteinivorax hydrogeniformans]|uniref:DEAD/DEAH box helicase n=1 Tax=Proteinivorax hydrogeniformans TaxID=1826727 RepID=A0AAU8HUM0_9FIRM
MGNKTKGKKLIVCFTQQGFKLDFISKKGPSSDNGFEEKIYKDYLENPYKMLFYLGFTDSDKSWSDSLSFLHTVAVDFITNISKTADIELSRENAVIIPSEDGLGKILDGMPFVIGQEFINAKWIEENYRKLTEVFADEIKDYSGTVEEFLLEHNSEINVVGRVYFHLVENKLSEHPFAFLATYSTEDKRQKKIINTPLKNALYEFKNQDDKILNLLSTVSKAAEKSEFISELVESGELFSPLKLTSEEAYTFLKEIPTYEECGILCRIPNWWKKKRNSLKISLKVGEDEPSQVGMDALLNFSPQLYLGDEKLTEAELKKLLAETDGLSYIKGKWIEVDQDKLRSTLEAYEKAKGLLQTGEYNIAEAIRMQLNGGELLNVEEDVDLEISNGQWLESVTSKMNRPRLIETTPLGDDFKAKLRNYQHEGVNWLRYMKDLGFGACLADDMGLGKTVQVIALLEHIRQTKSAKNLLIIPASLMGNWQKEIENFAPKLKYKMVYSSKEEVDLQNENINLYVTTYGMAVRKEELQTVKWDLVILDEAQAIKNPGTKQTKSVKQLEAKSKIALTGTPIENSLSDLWSLFDFLNPGLLGNAQEFKRFTKGLKHSQQGYSKLRSVVNPFILRRLKTDKKVISDLPEKMEMKTYASLSKKQAVLYSKLVEELEEKLQDSVGIERKGLVLASITKFKQICNHPDQYLGQNTYSKAQSGKFERLQDICETIYNKRERVLVFTQFREMTGPIADHLEKIFNRKGLTLHGGTPAKKRTELVEKFNGQEYVPFMVLSLKAGGVGLNLTSANHVIHFDRWWNPAVENQATDRAFRIGQQKNVMVHKLITSGTIEEKIDGMITGKSKLASDVVTSSKEKWITELDNDELMELFTLPQAGES